jgi:hypothetical protein
MLLFRSEEDIKAWCERSGEPRGPAISLATLWRLSEAWYGDRLAPSYRGRTREQVEAVFARFGLTGEHWRLA